MRAGLTVEINQLVEELAPAIFDDFYTNRIVPPSAKPQPRATTSLSEQPRRSTYGPQGQGTFFTHPMSKPALARFLPACLSSHARSLCRLGRRVLVRVVAIAGAQDARHRVGYGGRHE